MELRFEELTRGSGKIYLRAEWDIDVQDYIVRTRSVGDGDKDLPSAVHLLDDHQSCVVIIAVMNIPQTVSVVLEKEGAELASAQKTVLPPIARLTSQFNTFTKNAKAEQIRNIDEFPGQSPLFVSYDWLIQNDEKVTDIVHGKVTVVATTQEEANEEVELRFFDRRGNLLDGGAWTNMGDSCSKDKQYSGLFERTIGFSVRVPEQMQAIACWARQPKRNLFSIRCLEPHQMEDGRRSWDEYREAAQYTDLYDGFFRKYHKASPWELEAQRRSSFKIEPLFSIIVPIYRTPLPFFREMADSALGQTYSKLELILVNASPEDVKLSAELALYAQADDRVRIVRMRENLGIVGNTYAGVNKAKGDFIAFFDHDDVIEPDLLYHYVSGINKYPTTDLLYCDEDKLRDGHYECPFFKSDWNPDLLRSQNYVCHMLTVRKSIVDELPREGLEAFEGSQDHHLTLFAAERARNIYHARRAMYHWRMHAQSTAANAESKSYTGEAGVLAVQAHLDRIGLDATVRLSGVFPNTYHVDYKLANHPLVSVIIPNKDMVDVLDRCVTSILEASTYDAIEVVIVENNSEDEATFAYYESLAARDNRIKVVRQPSDGTFNFSRSINYGAAHSSGEYLLLLNNDTEVQAPNWIERMLGPATREDVGIVGAKLLYPDNLIQHAGVMLHRGTGPFHVSTLVPGDSLIHFCSAQLTSDYSAVTGACMLVSRSLFDELDGFDENLAVDYNDVDFCLRVRETGRLVVYEPEAVLTHYESISRGTHGSVAQKCSWCEATGYMLQRWTRYYAEGDPYANPNLAFSAYRKLIAGGDNSASGFC